MRKFNKIIGVGISKTGTTSLTAALNQLGIPSKHWPTKASDFYQYRGLTDTPVACRFAELDVIFPDSLFIYTERDEAGWLESATYHFRPKKGRSIRFLSQEANVKIYGRVNPEPTDLVEAYKRHHKRVLEYFKHRESNILRINITAGDGWGKLCSFLDTPTPASPFPHLYARPPFLDTTSFSAMPDKAINNSAL